MDRKLEDILKGLPPKPPRSRLEPYADLIDEMRLRGWTYRDIARVLAEKCKIQVSPSNVHHFVQLRTNKMKQAGSQGIMPVAPRKPHSAPVPESSSGTNAADVQQRIAAVKQHPSQPIPDSKGFVFDTSEPLRLRRQGKRIPDKTSD